MAEHRVVVAVLVRDGRALLCHRSPDRRWYPDVWDFPGGHVELGESAEEALRREIAEELGVEIGPVLGPAVLTLYDRSTGLKLSAWRVTDWKGHVENCALAEHDRIAWFASGELHNLPLADPSYVPLLRRLLPP